MKFTYEEFNSKSVRSSPYEMIDQYVSVPLNMLYSLPIRTEKQVQESINFLHALYTIKSYNQENNIPGLHTTTAFLRRYYYGLYNEPQKKALDNRKDLENFKMITRTGSETFLINEDYTTWETHEYSIFTSPDNNEQTENVFIKIPAYLFMDTRLGIFVSPRARWAAIILYAISKKYSHLAHYYEETFEEITYKDVKMNELLVYLGLNKNPDSKARKEVLASLEELRLNNIIDYTIKHEQGFTGISRLHDEYTLTFSAERAIWYLPSNPKLIANYKDKLDAAGIKTYIHLIGQEAEFNIERREAKIREIETQMDLYKERLSFIEDRVQGFSSWMQGGHQHFDDLNNNYIFDEHKKLIKELLDTAGLPETLIETLKAANKIKFGYSINEVKKSKKDKIRSSFNKSKELMIVVEEIMDYWEDKLNYCKKAIEDLKAGGMTYIDTDDHKIKGELINEQNSSYLMIKRKHILQGTKVDKKDLNKILTESFHKQMNMNLNSIVSRRLQEEKPGITQAAINQNLKELKEKAQQIKDAALIKKKLDL